MLPGFAVSLTERVVYTFSDRHLRMQREAQISGAKLLFRKLRMNPDGTLRSARAYLVFTCTVMSSSFL